MNLDNNKVTSSFVTAARPKGRQTAAKTRRRGLRKLATILFSVAAAGTDARAPRRPAGGRGRRDLSVYGGLSERP